MESTAIPAQLEPYMPYLIQVLYAVLIFIVGWVASKWTHSLLLRLMGNRKLDEALARFLASIARYMVLAATVIIALGAVGIETTSLVAILASAGLAIGLALQGSLANFAAGVMILLFRPFDLGDKITAAGNTGKVTDIGLFASTLVTPDNELVITPNSSITGDSIINHTKLGTLRGNIDVGVAYGTNVNQALKVMEKACVESDLVLKDPAPSVVFVGFGASSIDFVVRPWATSADYLNMLHNVRVKLYDRLNEADIEIPFDQIVVHNAV